jgi:hypothetical protein
MHSEHRDLDSKYSRTARDLESIKVSKMEFETMYNAKVKENIAA